MRGVNLDGRMCVCFHPTAKNTAARKNKHMLPSDVDHRQFQIAVEGCGCYALPIHSMMVGQLFGLGFDPHQVRRAESDGSLDPGAEIRAAWAAALPPKRGAKEKKV